MDAQFRFLLTESDQRRKKSLQINRLDKQYEITPGSTITLEIRKIILTGKWPDTPLHDVPVTLSVRYTEDVLKKDPIVKQENICRLILNHVVFEQDTKEMKDHIFRAWTTDPIKDASYYTDESGHKIIQCKIKDGKIMLYFLCLTEEIRRHRYWDLLVRFPYKDQLIEQCIPIQTVSCLREPPTRRKRFQEYYDFPAQLTQHVCEKDQDVRNKMRDKLYNKSRQTPYRTRQPARHKDGPILEEIMETERGQKLLTLRRLEEKHLNKKLEMYSKADNTVINFRINQLRKNCEN